MKYRGMAYQLRALGILGLMPFCTAIGHHAANVYFDVDTVIEVRGVISDLRWQNPHIAFTLISREPNGDETPWLIESNSVSSLRQLGVLPDQLVVGDVVTVAGWPARTGENRMSGGHVLQPDGSELVLRGSGDRYFTDGSAERISIAELETRNLGDAAERGMFRVWSTITGDPNQNRLWAESYPLTEAARSAQAAWDPVRDNPAIRCEPKGMPGIMNPPYPMEISERGDVIVIRQEEWDAVRTVYMNPDSTPASPERSLLGHSVGNWDGETLVVRTSHVSWPYFDGRGVHQSEQAVYEERFTVSADGRRLNYTIDTTDPETFTEPVRLDRFWVWLPGQQVEPYNCVPL